MRKVLGVFLVIAGTLILLTPFTPGSILLIIGLDILLGHRVKWWTKIKKKVKLLSGKLSNFVVRGR